MKLLALLIGFLAALFGAQYYESSAPIAVAPETATETATSTESIPPLVVASSTLSVPQQKPAVTQKPPAQVTQSSAPVAAPAEVPKVDPVVLQNQLDVASSRLRSALVNIICYSPAGSRIGSITGSGVIVDPKGIILTNAHIAQYFLYADRGVSCVIRSGSPARDMYRASLLYLDPAWVEANAAILATKDPSGTGEYDFAFVGINRSATSAALPSSFAYVPLAVSWPDEGTPVVIATYGAQFLNAALVQTALSPTVVFGSVKEIFTFDMSTGDVIELGGSAAAQEGSSGGGVAGPAGTLLAMITTSTVEGETKSRSLDAITAHYIRREFLRAEGRSLSSFLSDPISVSASAFAPRIAELEAVLVSHL